MAAVDELAYVTLADTLPVVKPTISHRMKILYEAGLINVRKSGRNLYYSLRRDVLHKLIDELWELAPASAHTGPVQLTAASGQGGPVLLIRT